MANSSVTESSQEIPRIQRRAAVRSICAIAGEQQERGEAMRAVYATGEYTLKEIAAYFGVHYSTVSRAVNAKP